MYIYKSIARESYRNKCSVLKHCFFLLGEVCHGQEKGIGLI